MQTHHVQTAKQRIATMASRRLSLVALGGAALAAATGEVAGKGGQSCGKKKQKRCRKDAAGCRNNLLAACAGDPDCAGSLTSCCETCSANGFVSCLIASGAIID
jgi:hypothetical protein